MKVKLTLLVLILLSNRAFGQLQADAGNDTILCVGMRGVDTTEIGGNPTASGGAEPYSYSWSTNYTIGSFTFWASDFLDDTTVSNPKILNDLEDNLKFKLLVTDNLGTQAEDSITIRFSKYEYTLVDYSRTILQGETITLHHNICFGIPPLSFCWSPNYNISDTTISNPTAWPDTSVVYSVRAIDSIGCISENENIYITVVPVGLDGIEKPVYASQVFPNPINGNSVITMDNSFSDNLSLHILGTNGQTILMDKFSSNQYKIGDKIMNKGMYFYVIKYGSKIISHGRFLKE